MNATRMNIAYSVAFIFIFIIIAGLALTAYYNFFVFKSADAIPGNMPPAREAPSDTQGVTGRPVRLAVDKLGIDLVINPGAYDETSRTWTLNDSNVFIDAHTNIYSGKVGQLPESHARPLLYGHNSHNVLGKADRLQPGDNIKVLTDNNHLITYEFTRSKKVSPDDTWILDYKGTEDLLIMTCSGTWNEKRLVSFFEIDSIDRIKQ